MYEVLGFLLLVTSIGFANSKGITCYQCSSTRDSYIPGMLPCSEFDWSYRFEKECPMSTFCLRRTYTVPLGDEKIQSVEMGCAPQKLDARNYNRRDRTWYSEVKVIDEIYKDGCSLAEVIGRPGEPTEYCYCSYPLCNGSNSLSKISYFVFLLHTVAMMIYFYKNVC